MTRFFGLVALMAVSSACGDSDPGALECSSDTQCNTHPLGSCVSGPTGSWCQYGADDCPSGTRWSEEAGDGLAGMCVAEQDAGADAAVPAQLSTKIVVTPNDRDSLFVFSADTLESVATVPLPDRTGTGNWAATITGHTLWVTSPADVTALDATALTVRAGYPKAFDKATTCDVTTAIFNSGHMLCTTNPLEAVSGDVGLYDTDLDFVRSVSLEWPKFVAGSETRLLVVYGVGAGSVGVYDNTLSPVVGSPLAAMSGQIRYLAISDPLNRIAAAASQVELFDRTTLQPVGSHDFGHGVYGMVFDESRSRLVVTIDSGGDLPQTAALDLNGEVVVAAASQPGLSLRFLTGLVLDPTRDRIYAVAGDRLVILDAETLMQVDGSPVTLPAAAGSVAFY